MTVTTPDTLAGLRNADLQMLATALHEQRTRSIDVVVPAKLLRATLGAVELAGVAPAVSDDGVTQVDGFYRPTTIADEGLADKLGVPLAYLRRCRGEAVELYDANLNGWLARSGKSFLLRLLTHRDGPGADSTAGVLRAFLSDRYRCIDHLDVLLAALEGLRQAGVGEPVIDADLTERRMAVRVTVPQIRALAPTLLDGYHNPFNRGDRARGWVPEALAGHGSATDPIVFAGFVISNSETGGGRFQVTPRIVAKVCTNGMTITRDALSNVHLGGALDEGVIRWSEATLRKNLDLVTGQTRDAVATFLDPAYLRAKVDELEELAGTPLSDPPVVIADVSKRLGFSDTERAEILGHFVRGGVMTAAGVMHAVTAAAQTQPAERRWELEQAAIPTLTAAAALAA